MLPSQCSTGFSCPSFLARALRTEWHVQRAFGQCGRPERRSGFGSDGHRDGRGYEGGSCRIDRRERAVYEVVTKLFSVTAKEKSTINPTELTLRIFANCGAVLSGVEERLRQFGCPKHIRDAL